MTTTDKISGTICSASLNSPIEEVKVLAFNQSDELISTTKSDEQGKWQISQSENITYISFSKEGYIKKTLIVDQIRLQPTRLLEDRIIGYQQKHFFKPGETIKAFVSSSAKFNAELIRHGYKISKVMDLGNHEPSYQELPDGFFVETGLKWNATFTYELPKNLQSGFYSLKLTSLEKEEHYIITFVVSPPKENYGTNAKLLVLASTNNWQTYNVWGGRSRYRNFENPITSHLTNKLKTLGLRIVPEPLKVLTKNIFRKNTVVTIKDHPNAFQFRRLSINRPHPDCSINDSDIYDTFTSHLSSNEWRTLGWLEKNNIPYDLISGYELHNNPDILNHYKAIMLNSHSEYWSKDMFTSLKKFNEMGGAVLNLSGNSIYREVEFYEDSSLHCVSLRFADSAEDETKLIGVRFDMRGYGSCNPYKVLKSGHWIFEGTNVKNGDLFGKKNLNHNSGNFKQSFEKDPASSPGMAPLKGEGASGWETDKLSKTAPKDFILLAKGTNIRNGGAEMVIREKEGNGLVFSASSITFGASLLVDETCSLIVLNVLKKVLN